MQERTLHRQRTTTPRLGKHSHALAGLSPSHSHAPLYLSSLLALASFLAISLALDASTYPRTNEWLVLLVEGGGGGGSCAVRRRVMPLERCRKLKPISNNHSNRTARLQTTLTCTFLSSLPQRCHHLVPSTRVPGLRCLHVPLSNRSAQRCPRGFVSSSYGAGNCDIWGDG